MQPDSHIRRSDLTERERRILFQLVHDEADYCAQNVPNLFEDGDGMAEAERLLEKLESNA